VTGRKGRHPKKYSQAERLAQMIRVLASRAVTVNELAEECGITRRQVYRDLARIQEEGHPLTHEGGHGEGVWQLPLNYKGLPPITLSPYELMSLHLAKSHLDYLAGTPFADDVTGVINKIKAGLPRRTIAHLERILQVFVPRHRMVRSYGAKKSLLEVLRQALLLQRTVTLSHRKPDAEETVEHRVDPYSLLLHMNGLYLVGYSHRAKDLRTFAVERMSHAELTEERFDIPPDFSPKAITQRAFGIIDEPPRKIRIRFSREVAHLLKEREWHPTQRVTPLADGGVILTMEAGGLQELTKWVLSWGAHAEVLAPAELIKEVKAHLTAAQQHYTPKAS